MNSEKRPSTDSQTHGGVHDATQTSPSSRYRQPISVETPFLKTTPKFTPESYIRQRMNRLYKMVFLLTATIWSLRSISDIFVWNWKDEQLKLYRSQLNTFVSAIASLFFVPTLMSRYCMSYCINISSIGMAISALLYYQPDQKLITVATVPLAICQALFDTAIAVYFVRLAKGGARVLGTALWSVHFILFGIYRMAWAFRTVTLSTFLYSLGKNNTNSHNRHYSKCGPSHVIYENVEVTSTTSSLRFFMFSGNTETLFLIALMTGVLGGIFLIVVNLDLRYVIDEDLSPNPTPAGIVDIRAHLRQPKVTYVVILYIVSVFMDDMSDEFVHGYTGCLLPSEFETYTLLFSILPSIVGTIGIYSIIEIFGTHLPTIVILGTLICGYFYALAWNFHRPHNEIDYFIMQNIISLSCSFMMSIMDLMTLQTMGDHEIPAWCIQVFCYHSTQGISVTMYKIWRMSVKLWVNITLTFIAIIVVLLHRYTHNRGYPPVHIDETCLQDIQIDTKLMLMKDANFDFYTLVKQRKDIGRIDTFKKYIYILE